MGNADSDTVQMSGARVRFIPVDENANYELSEWGVEAGAEGPPIHVHHAHDEGFYVLDGRFGFALDGVTTFAGAGTHVLVPKGH